MNLFDIIDTAQRGSSLLNVLHNPKSIIDSLASGIDSVQTYFELNKYASKYSKTNLYKSVIEFPPFMNSLIRNEEMRSFDLFTKSISVPSTSLNQKVVRVGQTRRSTTGVVDTDTFSLSVYDTHNNFYHTMFNIWMDGKNNRGNGSLKYWPDDFKGSFSVFRDQGVDVESKSIKMLHQIYEMEEVYPLSVGDLRFDDDETDSHQIFDVTFYTKRLKQFNKEF